MAPEGCRGTLSLMAEASSPVVGAVVMGEVGQENRLDLGVRRLFQAAALQGGIRFVRGRDHVRVQ